MKLVLASKSRSRRALLAAAGVPHEAVGAGVDEEQAKSALHEVGLDARRMADALAELKAWKLSQKRPTDLVLGSDSTLATAEGSLLDKPTTRDEARDQLRRLRNTTHRLVSAAVICEGGRPVWRHVDTARLTMRSFSDGWLEAYLEAEWPTISGCVGGYRLEDLGVQLFSRIEGSHFTVLGLPLLPLLDYLRVRGVMRS